MLAFGRRSIYDDPVAETLASYARVLAVVAVLIAVLNPGGLRVLCLGQDGHRAIELAHHLSACHAADTSSSTHDSEQSLSSDSDPHCTDFALGLNIDSRTPRGSEPLAHLLANPPLLYSILTCDARTAGPAHDWQTPAGALMPSHAPVLRSTVLLL